ncbi:MAG: methyl-accepting chemotaxis protein [Myxococcaceae bacterium]
MEDSGPPRTYKEFLRSRWPSRVSHIAIVGLVVSPTALLFDWIFGKSGLFLNVETSLAEMALIRLGIIVAPIGAWVSAKIIRDVRWLPRVTFVWACIYAVAHEIAFYLIGTNGTLFHTTFIYLDLVVPMSILPVERVQRFAFYMVFWVGHAVAEVLYGADVGAGTQFWNHLILVGGAFSLTIPLEMVYNGHRKQFDLRREMGIALEELRGSREHVSIAGSTLARSVVGLSEATNDLSRQAESARGESHHIAAASEQMATSARQLAERSKEGAARVGEARDYTDNIDGLVREMEQSMSEIGAAVSSSEASFARLEEHSEKIDVFITTLEEIAAETHMLALNASIEASRAGEHGRGFMVVSNETRRLAEQSASRSKEIKADIGGIRRQLALTRQAIAHIRSKVSGLSGTYGRTRSMLETVNHIVESTAEVMESNTREAVQQSSASETISAGTHRLMQAIQAHAQMSEVVAETAEELRRLAGELERLLPGTEAVAAVNPSRRVA